MQIDSFEKDVMEYVKPKHGTTTLGFIFKHGVIIAVDSRASMGSYICKFAHTHSIKFTLSACTALPCKLRSVAMMSLRLSVQLHRR